MAFELIEKGHKLEKLSPFDISIMKTGISFGKEIEKDFIENGFYCEVYFDYEGRRVGFKPTANSLTGFKIQIGNETHQTAYMSLPKVSGRILKGRYKAIKEGNTWVVHVPEIATKNVYVSKEVKNDASSLLE